MKNEKLSIEQIIEIANGYKHIYGICHIPQADKLIEYCEIVKAVGLNFYDKQVFTDAWDRCCLISKDLFVELGKNIKLINSVNKYQFENNKYYVRWNNGNIGRLQFVSDKYYSYSGCDEAYEKFGEKIRSYGALDYNKCNDDIIFTVEDGLRLAHDYKKICEDTKSEFNEIVKKAKLEEAKRNYENAIKQLGGKE